MKINNNYSLDQIESTGLKEKEVKDLQARVSTQKTIKFIFLSRLAKRN